MSQNTIIIGMSEYNLPCFHVELICLFLSPFVIGIGNGIGIGDKHQWRSQGGPLPPVREKKIRMVGNGGPATGRLILRVTKYSGFQDAFIRFPFPVFPVPVDRKMKMSLFSMCMMANGY